MSEDNIFIGYLGPLAFSKMENIPGKEKEEITYEDIIKYLSSENIVPEIDNFKKSYKQISENINKLFIVPHEYRILNKLIYPLKRALGSYIIGNYLGTIALCGMVAEMSIIFHYETLKIKINERESDEVIKKLYKREFEKLGQEQRVNFLHALGFIPDDLVKKFDTVRDSRRGYLHLLSKEHQHIAPDAKRAFDATLDIVVKILGVKIGEPGKMTLNQNVIDYLNSKGLIEKPNNNDDYSELANKYDKQE